jgi:hypothetical protein
MELIAYTLTYPDNGSWGANDLRAFRSRMDAEVGAQEYYWVGELQKRGVIHYHYMTLWQAGCRWDKNAVEEWWGKGIVWVTYPVEKPGYLVKYLSKGSDDERGKFPKGARIFGWSQRLLDELTDAERSDRRRGILPRWVVTEVGSSANYNDCRYVGGCWQYNDKTLDSPWRVVCV